ncbi:MAG: Fe-S cluster assembly ATP-binding protein [Myxococcota bacterium]|jgi:Fe-S cluster assembly ATP-binding protein
MLSIQDLHVQVAGTEILKGLTLDVPTGEVHAMMGPNGSGKSTLSYTICGKEGYEVTSGDILLDGVSVLEMSPDERARAGLFLAFQYPVEIPGVRSRQFLRASVNAVRAAKGQDELKAVDFLKLLKSKAAEAGVDQSFTTRDLNSGFSGGEKKRFEVLQMSLLEPKMCIMDETDSGLDIDALKAVSDGVNHLRSPERSMLVITHYQRLLSYIVPDVVHVLKEGRIVRSGDKGLALELEEKGYDWVTA